MYALTMAKFRKWISTRKIHDFVYISERHACNLWSPESVPTTHAMIVYEDYCRSSGIFFLPPAAIDCLHHATADTHLAWSERCAGLPQVYDPSRKYNKHRPSFPQFVRTWKSRIQILLAVGFAAVHDQVIFRSVLCLAAVQVELLLVTADALIQTKHFEMPFHRLRLVVAPAFMAAFPSCVHESQGFKFSSLLGLPLSMIRLSSGRSSALPRYRWNCSW